MSNIAIETRRFALPLVALSLGLGVTACSPPPPQQVVLPVQVVQPAPLTVAPMPPPPARTELVPPPPGGYAVVWQPGYWRFTGMGTNGWEWVAGNYVQPPAGRSRWMPGQWSQQATGGWVWSEGHWM